MASWTFEPGHTSAEFRSRHMMVTWVRGSFKNVTGSAEWDLDNPTESRFDAVIDAGAIWTGDAKRDDHLRSPDFLDAANHPKITFASTGVEQVGQNDYKVTGNLTIRGVTKEVVLDVAYLGQWETPFYVGNEDKGPKMRAGFSASTQIDRHDFGVSWNPPLARGGLVVGSELQITIDAEALLD